MGVWAGICVSQQAAGRNVLRGCALVHARGFWCRDGRAARMRGAHEEVVGGAEVCRGVHRRLLPRLSLALRTGTPEQHIFSRMCLRFCMPLAHLLPSPNRSCFCTPAAASRASLS